MPLFLGERIKLSKKQMEHHLFRDHLFFNWSIHVFVTINSLTEDYPCFRLVHRILDGS